MKIDTAAQAIYVFKRLQKIATSLSKLDTYDCNYGLTERQEKREAKLVSEAQELAKELGLKAYHQSDPRGCSLYLIDSTMDNSNYNKGIAIY